MEIGREIERFAPEMPYQILHKSDLGLRQFSSERENFYISLLWHGFEVRRIKGKKGLFSVDEAQYKNPGTKQTKAVKAIPGKMKIAMTGTPIENRLRIYGHYLI